MQSSLKTQTAGVYMLTAEHAAEIQVLASDPAIAATTRVPHPYPPDGACEFIERQLQEKSEGRAHVFAIKDQNRVVGVCGIHDIAGDVAQELGFWIGRPYWGKGYATLGAKMVLQFAFQNLPLARVKSAALESNLASRHVLEKSGFQLLRVEKHNDPRLKRPDELMAAYEITRAQWLEARDGPAIKRLHPALQVLLKAELAAGNEISETGGGWPEEKSVFVKLRHRFRAKPAVLSADVVYSELNDPHWWFADYSAGKPPHILAC